MSKIKKQVAVSKVSADNTSKKCSSNPSFSFEHLTSNTKYNFEFFGKDKNLKISAKAAVCDRLQEISQQTWIFWNSQRKAVGIETLKADDLYFKPCGYDFSDDEKVIVFRFSFLRNDCRIIGIKKSPCSVYYIIGFDFNHNAYDHGS